MKKVEDFNDEADCLAYVEGVAIVARDMEGALRIAGKTVDLNERPKAPTARDDLFQQGLRWEAYVSKLRTALSLSNPRQYSASDAGSSAGDLRSSTCAGSTFVNGVPVTRDDRAHYRPEYDSLLSRCEKLETALTKLGVTPPHRLNNWEFDKEPVLACADLSAHETRLTKEANKMKIDTQALLAGKGAADAKANIPPPKTDTKLTLTEQVLAANGVKTIEELNEKKKYDRPLKLSR